jgi:hypothetical protein
MREVGGSDGGEEVGGDLEPLPPLSFSHTHTLT